MKIVLALINPLWLNTLWIERREITMSITINDGFSLSAAITASASAREVESLLNEAESLLNKMASECDVAVDDALAHLENVQACAVVATNEINAAIDEYTNEPAHTEGLETAGRV